MMKNATAKITDIFVARGSICFNIDILLLILLKLYHNYRE